MSRKITLHICFGFLTAILLTSGAWPQTKNRADIAILRWYAATRNNFVRLPN
jgi:hypothetical protein